MQYKKNKHNIQFDVSIEQLGPIHEDINMKTNLIKRPVYQIKNIEQTSNCIFHIMKNNEIKKKTYIENQKELSHTTRKPFNKHFLNYDSQLFPLINTKQNPLPNFFELSKLFKLTDTPRISNRIKLRSESTDERFKFHKSYSNKKLQKDFKNIEEQFQETKNLIKRFDRIKTKKVRFDDST